jgi:hypothetical protein
MYGHDIIVLGASLGLKQAKISSPEGVQSASGAVRTLVAPLRAEQLGSSRD